ncbi:cytochrome c oxidase accessory protein CcoG [Simplicispira psychrophila]|uniref:cytochrome c oxidase accessory protein CcoG n=1 Tax=Simplicispira psychrophila TaxID=80882 RepID=UPI00068EE2FB|nr:cytochrome c oxidase accessory protein CcoG [Simplicispira psychrophila]
MSHIPLAPHGKSPRKVIPIAPVPAAGSLYEAQVKIQARSMRGVFANWRWALVWATQLFFYVIPWLQWNGRQMLLFDLEQRRFYLFELLLFPQDFIYLTALLIIAALSLFLFTAVAGRLWCGFACPQTVYTEIFMWIEHRVEGDRSARLRLDASPWSKEKLRKKFLKQLLWLAVALWTGFTFVGYFVPIRTLAVEVMALQGGWQIFWVLFYGFATYGNAGFLREQICKYMCPYARFQSAMFDQDTLIVTYDAVRGEMRGPRTKAVDAKVQGLGDCIDCTLCVQVCPVGIDIREGLQYECIGCGLCVDACNSVMDKMQYPRGLIRYTTPNALAQRWSLRQVLRRVARPRVLLYSAALLALTGAMVSSLVLRTPLKVDVIRDRSVLARLVEGGQIENVYRLQIANATETPQRYRLVASGLEGLHVASDTEVDVAAAESRWVVVRLRVPAGVVAAVGSHPVGLEISATGDTAVQLREKTTFLMPR